MDWQVVHNVIVVIQHCISFIGVLIIMTGVFVAAGKYIVNTFTGQLLDKADRINNIRLDLGRVLILGLEFIVAADLIGTTTTPDYYEVGLLAIIVVIRTILSFSINRELMSIAKEGA